MAKKPTTRALPTVDEILRRQERKRIRLMIERGVRLRKRGGGKLRLS
jgi:hypothetical protein